MQPGCYIHPSSRECSRSGGNIIVRPILNDPARMNSLSHDIAPGMQSLKAEQLPLSGYSRLTHWQIYPFCHCIVQGAMTFVCRARTENAVSGYP